MQISPSAPGGAVCVYLLVMVFVSLDDLELKVLNSSA